MTNSTDTSVARAMGVDWSQIKFFKPHEFDSPGNPGSGEMMVPEFVAWLDLIRAKAQVPFVINSAYRTPEHNEAVGGVHNSPHMLGCAVDIAAPDSKTYFSILEAAISCGCTRIGMGKNFIHLDLDGTKPQGRAWTYPGV